MTTSIDIVSALHVPDLERFQILHECLERFWDIPGKRFVIVSRSDAPVIRKALPARYEVVVENDLIDIVAMGLPGWWRQQLRKLAAGLRLVTTPHYQILDADTILLRKVESAELVDEAGRGYCLIIPPACHDGWHQGAARIFGLPTRTPRTMCATPMFFSCDVVRRMAEVLDGLYGNWQRHLARNELWNSPETWTEGSLYMTAAESQQIFDRYHFESKPMVGPSIWYPEQKDAWSAAEAFSSGRAFSIIQSATNIPPGWVRDAIAPFLP